MKAQGNGLALVVLFLAFLPSYASTVRTANVDNGAMAPIYVKMGKTTVLRFVEKPKKVVVGNQNYYGLEFIENDVAIQPLGSVGTNLFVYTQNHTYGFLLTPSERYDDLVFVRWKYPKAMPEKALAPPPKTVVLPNLNFKLGHDLRITVVKIQGPSTFGLHMIDLSIENLGNEELSLAGLSLFVTRNGKALENQSVVLECDKLKNREKTKFRIVLKLESKADLFLEGRFKNLKGQMKIGKKYL